MKTAMLDSVHAIAAYNSGGLVPRVQIEGNECLVCGHVWYSRGGRPLRCAKCRSPYWDREKSVGREPRRADGAVRRRAGNHADSEPVMQGAEPKLASAEMPTRPIPTRYIKPETAKLVEKVLEDSARWRTEHAQTCSCLLCQERRKAKGRKVYRVE